MEKIFATWAGQDKSAPASDFQRHGFSDLGLKKGEYASKSGCHDAFTGASKNTPPYGWPSPAPPEWLPTPGYLRQVIGACNGLNFVTRRNSDAVGKTYALEESKMDEQAGEKFAAELERRFVALQEWAIENWPDPDNKVTAAEFTQARKEVHLIVASLRHENLGAPEPSEGGPQYINMNATPWP